jgi:hypothetical protein
VKGLTIIAVLLLASSAAALELPEACRVRNRVGGFCTFACLDALARCHNVKPLQGILEAEVARSPNGSRGYDDKVNDRLQALGVPFLLQRHGDYRRDLLERYAETRGCVVTLRHGNPWSIGSHSVTVLRYADEVKFYDPNRTQKIWTCGRGWFDYWWGGNAIVILEGAP